MHRGHQEGGHGPCQPCGFQNPGTGADQAAIDDVRQPGMIADVSLRMLYLIFRQVLGLILLMGRTSSTKDVELLVLRHEVAVPGAPTRDHAWTGRTGPSSPPSSGGCHEHCAATA